MNKIVTWYSYRHVWWENGWWCECRYVFPSCSPWRVSLRSPLSLCIPLWISDSRREIWNPLVTSLGLVKLLKNVLSYLRSFSIKVFSWKPFFFFPSFCDTEREGLKKEKFSVHSLWRSVGRSPGRGGLWEWGTAHRAALVTVRALVSCQLLPFSLLSPPLPSLPSLSKALKAVPRFWEEFRLPGEKNGLFIYLFYLIFILY